jgi:hypothetical protein
MKMRIKKTISQKVIEANRRNAQRSPGPISIKAKDAVRYNAMTHGLLAKRIVFRNEEEEAEFKALTDELEQEFRPEGVLEQMLAEEIGVVWWKLQIVQGWEFKEIRSRRKASKSMIRTLVQESDETQFPLFQGEDGSSCATGLNWDCDELVVRRSSREFEKDEIFDKEKRGNVEIEARLTTSIETILRYMTRLKRDLYKAIRVLGDLQDRRARVSGSTPAVPLRKKLER